jgi:DNA modification methylase
MPRKTITKMTHPTEKPEWLIMRAIKNSSRVGNLIVDLFGGSGSTLFASHKLERNCCLMELDPIWCDVIRKRWEKVKPRR